jgi:hypothetical protein
LLATDSCYDTIKTANGDAVQRRTTYLEIATPSQAPTESCNVHGEPRARLARDFPSSDLPRAALAVDLSGVAAIEIKNPTLLADKDPYNSLRPKLKPEPALKPEPTPQPATETADIQKTENVNSASEGKTASNPPSRSRSETQTPESTSEIRKAIPVEPIRKAIPVAPQEKKPVEIRRAIPVKPLDQEDEQESLLRSATPPPGDLDQ